jgi:hypothetical protein
MKNLNLKPTEQQTVTENLQQITWLNCECLKETFTDSTEQEVKETLRKYTNLMICQSVINMYTSNDEIKEELNDLIAEILAELD